MENSHIIDNPDVLVVVVVVVYSSESTPDNVNHKEALRGEDKGSH